MPQQNKSPMRGATGLKNQSAKRILEHFPYKKPLAPLAWRVVDAITSGNPPKCVIVWMDWPSDQVMSELCEQGMRIAVTEANPLAYRWQWAQGLDLFIYAFDTAQVARGRVLAQHLVGCGAWIVQVWNFAEDDSRVEFINPKRSITQQLKVAA